MKVLPCGHVAHKGQRRVCPHLLGERADELDTFWVLRGVGVEYDLCCAACGKAGQHPELVVACEGCVAWADDRWSVTMSRTVLPTAPLDVAPLDACPGEWLLLTSQHLVRWNARTGEIMASADGTLVVSDGWVWHPVGLPRVWDVRRWRYEDLYEAEDGESARSLRQVGYYWDKPMCWLDNSRLAVAGIGAEAMIPGVEVYDVRTTALVASFAGPTGRLHCDRERLYASSPGGLQIWDSHTGENTGAVPGFVPTHYHAGGRELAVINDGALVTWSTR